jgi:hypothetical protein
VIGQSDEPQWLLASARRPTLGRMPSGYEKSPDYGGPEPTLGGVIFAIAVMIAVSAVVARCALGVG